MGFSFGSSVAVPDSFVYKFFKETNEVRVLKTRTIQVVPEDLNDVVGKLRKYEGNGEEDEDECDDFEDDTILLICSTDWRKEECKLRQEDQSIRFSYVKSRFKCINLTAVGEPSHSGGRSLRIMAISAAAKFAGESS